MEEEARREQLAAEQAEAQRAEEQLATRVSDAREQVAAAAEAEKQAGKTPAEVAAAAETKAAEIKEVATVAADTLVENIWDNVRGRLADSLARAEAALARAALATPDAATAAVDPVAAEARRAEAEAEAAEAKAEAEWLELGLGLLQAKEDARLQAEEAERAKLDAQHRAAHPLGGGHHLRGAPCVDFDGLPVTRCRHCRDGRRRGLEEGGAKKPASADSALSA